MNEVFTIPVGDLTQSYENLYYSPLTGMRSFSPIILEGDECKRIRSLSDIGNLRKMSVLPNNRCNFNCSYCYAAQGRDTSELDIETTRKALDFFIDRQRCNRPLSVAILGGGEPLLSKEVTFDTISYARSRAEKEGIVLELTLVTNASLIDENTISYLKKYNVIVNASFDLLKDVQDSQRKDFLGVKTNIQEMSDAGVYVTINSTITPLNVDRMREMVENAHMWFPKVKFMIFEPVISYSLFEDAHALRDFYRRYIEEFFKARRTARDYGMDLTCRIEKCLDSCQDRGCEGRFNLCPNGDVTICYCTASPLDPNFANRHYGRVTASGVEIYYESFKKICEENVYSFEKCDGCFARYNCAGGCMLHNDRYPEEFLDEVCWFNREFIRRELVNSIIEMS